MKKVLRIEKQGWIWHIDASAIADNRAKYYANDPDSSYQEEYDYVMSKDGEDEIVDWYFNNMDWEDVPNDNKRLVLSAPTPSKPSDIETDYASDSYDLVEAE